MACFRLIKGGVNGPRIGSLTLPSGIEVNTPLFMPVATKMSVKTLEPGELEGTNTEAVITNGFLSSLEPGSDVVRKLGGMHRMMVWKGGIFSDSGGFQFIRKGFDAEVMEEGVRLRSPFTGEGRFITPEDVVDMHFLHGVDVGMVLDHCPPFPSSRDQVLSSANRTVYWARRSSVRAGSVGMEELLPNGRSKPLLFAITQGGIFKDIREECTKKLAGIGFPGYGIGGLSIGESKEETFASLRASTSLIPEGSPRYFMGVGDPDDIIRSVLSGVDIFDSVFPTRNARHRSVFTQNGRENIRAAAWKGREGPIMEGCSCSTCSRFSRGYIYHLFRTEEPLGPRLASLHNVHYMQDLISRIRQMVTEDRLSTFIPAKDLFTP